MTFTSFIKPESDPISSFQPSHSIYLRILLKGSHLKTKSQSLLVEQVLSAIAEGYAQAGGHVIILDHASSDNGLTKRLSSAYGVKSKFFQIDVTNSQQVQQVISQIDEEFGTIDVFVANAGIAWYTGSILNEDSTPENWRRVLM